MMLNKSEQNIYTLENNQEYMKELTKNYEFNLKSLGNYEKKGISSKNIGQNLNSKQ